ncbi:hypothetical protein N9Y42_02925 [Mariniblastus sp.]|nr:hypothetical protein [Mariniblastus sp.]
MDSESDGTQEPAVVSESFDAERGQPAVQVFENLGLASQNGSFEALEQSVLAEYEVRLNKANLELIKSIFQHYDSQLLYAEKLLFKDCLLEAYGLKAELLESKYSDRYPDDTRELVAKYFKSTDEAHRQGLVVINSYLVRQAIEKKLKELYLTGESASLVDLNWIYNASFKLNAAIRFLQSR